VRDRNRHHTAARTCARCGAAFTAKASLVARGGGLYCSGACYHAAADGRQVAKVRARRVDRTCDICGASFAVAPSRAKRGSGKYCSKGCADVALRRRHYRNKSGGAYKQWRGAVLKRDGGRCQRCGTIPASPHAHHIKPWETHPELRFIVGNGETLCPACHAAEHPDVPVMAHHATPSHSG
jgi:5-methylcytosine-specific restriction endonuclease McrA